MRTRAGAALTASLVFFAAGCGGKPPPEAEAEPAAGQSAEAGAVEVTVHVKDMTKVLNIT
jgi:hypothetical protein